MNLDLIKPITESTTSVFSVMLGCEARVLNHDFSLDWNGVDRVTGVIGISGKVSAHVVINFEKAVALWATTQLTGGNPESIEEVVDAVGELTNMIAGQAKSSLSRLKLTLALPSVIVGRDHEIRFASSVKPSVVVFATEWGNFSIEVGIGDIAGGMPKNAAAVATA